MILSKVTRNLGHERAKNLAEGPGMRTVCSMQKSRIADIGL